jgi:hypothetical protein
MRLVAGYQRIRLLSMATAASPSSSKEASGTAHRPDDDSSAGWAGSGSLVSNGFWPAGPAPLPQAVANNARIINNASSKRPVFAVSWAMIVS